MSIELCVSDIETNIMLATFSNGNLINSNSLKDIQLYRNSNPSRNLKHKILVTETSRLRYKGANFGQGSCAQLSSLCRNYIGILDKNTNKMHIVDSDWFNLKPDFGNANDDDNGKQKEDMKTSETQEDVTNKRKKQQEDLTMTFGSRTKQKTVESRRRLTVNLQDLSAKMRDTVDKIEVKEPEPKSEGLAAVEKLLPPINRNATIEADICNINDIVSEEDLDILKEQAIVLAKRTDEDIEAWRVGKRFSSFVLNSLSYLPVEDLARLQKCKLLLYYHCLVTLLRVTYKELQTKSVFVDVIPEPIRSRFLKNYFLIGKNRYRTMTQENKDRISAQVIALALILDDFRTEANVLQLDMKIPEKKFKLIVQILGAQILKTAVDKEIKEIIIWAAPLPSVLQGKLKSVERKSHRSI